MRLRCSAPAISAEQRATPLNWCLERIQASGTYLRRLAAHIVSLWKEALLDFAQLSHTCRSTTGRKTCCQSPRLGEEARTVRRPLCLIHEYNHAQTDLHNFAGNCQHCQRAQHIVSQGRDLNRMVRLSTESDVKMLSLCCVLSCQLGIFDSGSDESSYGCRINV